MVLTLDTGVLCLFVFHLTVKELSRIELGFAIFRQILLTLERLYRRLKCCHTGGDQRAERFTSIGGETRMGFQTDPLHCKQY